MSNQHKQNTVINNSDPIGRVNPTNQMLALGGKMGSEVVLRFFFLHRSFLLLINENHSRRRVCWYVYLGKHSSVFNTMLTRMKKKKKKKRKRDHQSLIEPFDLVLCTQMRTREVNSEIFEHGQFFVRGKRSWSPIFLVLIEARGVAGMLHSGNNRWLHFSSIDIVPFNRGKDRLILHFAGTISTGTETFVGILVE